MNKEVWQHQSSFGRAAYEKIDNFLRLMVNCETEKEWNFAYQPAMKVLADDPAEKCSKLDAIHNNPSYTIILWPILAPACYCWCSVASSMYQARSYLWVDQI
jgi:hypothetical protein